MFLARRKRFDDSTRKKRFDNSIRKKRFDDSTRKNQIGLENLFQNLDSWASIFQYLTLFKTVFCLTRSLGAEKTGK